MIGNGEFPGFSSIFWMSGGLFSRKNTKENGELMTIEWFLPKLMDLFD